MHSIAVVGGEVMRAEICRTEPAGEDCCRTEPIRTGRRGPLRLRPRPWADPSWHCRQLLHVAGGRRVCRRSVCTSRRLAVALSVLPPLSMRLVEAGLLDRQARHVRFSYAGPAGDKPRGVTPPPLAAPRVGV